MQQQVLGRYALSLAMAAIAVALRWVLDPLLGHVAFYVTVYAAVAFCALVCGLGPAILSAILGFIGTFYWFVDPRHSLTFSRPSEIHGIIGFFFVCATLIVLGETNRRKRLALGRTIVALRSEVSERRRAQEDLRKTHEELERRVEERTNQVSEALALVKSEVTVRRRTEDQLRQLSIRLMTLQDQERRRIARDLHDTVGQTLAAVKMSAATVQQLAGSHVGILQALAELNSFADAALQEIRTTSYLLHPPLLDEAGIASAARWFVEGFARRSAIRAYCEISDGFERPPNNYELVLFRILQETLTNVHRHSGATAVAVRFSFSGRSFTLEITDNGNGIPQERLKAMAEATDGAGVGILGMRERVHELGGRFSIRSDSAGTAVTVDLPLKASRSEAQHNTTAA
jgi:signal transduction histidine kinase